MRSDRLTLAQLYPVICEWSETVVGRPAPSYKTLANWAWDRQKFQFPEPLTHARPRTWDVAEVLTWLLDRG